MARPVYVVGDLHGCYHTLLRLVARLPENADLIFVGDLCDGGRYTPEVVEFVKRGGYRCVLGNHDVHMLLNLEAALKGKSSDWSTLPKYAGHTTVESYRRHPPSLVKEHLEWLRGLPQAIETQGYLITHGFGLPFYGIDHPRREFFMRVNRLGDARYKEWYRPDYERLGIINIFGHDAFCEIRRGPNYCAIDTGVKRGHRLTAVRLGTLEALSVPADDRDFGQWEALL